MLEPHTNKRSQSSIKSSDIHTCERRLEPHTEILSKTNKSTVCKHTHATVWCRGCCSPGCGGCLTSLEPSKPRLFSFKVGRSGPGCSGKCIFMSSWGRQEWEKAFQTFSGGSSVSVLGHGRAAKPPTAAPVPLQQSKTITASWCVEFPTGVNDNLL